MLVALVFLLRDRGSGGERPVALQRVDDDGSSDVPFRITPTDPRLPDAALVAPLPDTYLTEAFTVRDAIEPVTPVVIDVPAEPEPAPVSVTSARSSALGNAATAAAFLVLAIVRVRRPGRGPLRKGAEPQLGVVPEHVG